MARLAYSSNFEVRAHPEGGFRALYEILDAAGDVVEAGDTSHGQATADLALSQARSRAGAAIAALVRRAGSSRP